MTDETGKRPGKFLGLRYTLAGVFLVVLSLAGAYFLGFLDTLAIKRVEYLAQSKTDQWDNTWYGIRIMQYPEDLLSYENVVHDVRPDVIIETGTAYGGTTLYLATILENINPNGKIYTVDIDAKAWEGTLKTIQDQPAARLLKRIEFMAGSSTAPEIVARMTAAAKGASKVLIILDSAHGKGHVLEELKLYSPLVSPENYVIVNDTHLDGTKVLEYQDGPLAAVREFMATTKDFTIDHKRDRFYLSCMRSGFLKRNK